MCGCPCRRQVWLQEFAWTEGDKPVKLEARSIMAPNNPELARQPIFCFQTMMNLLYWSCFVYDHTREGTSTDVFCLKLLSTACLGYMLRVSLADTASRCLGLQFRASHTHTLALCAQALMTPQVEISKPSDDPDESSGRQQEKLQGTSFSASTSLTLETAMSLYQLTESQSFWEIEQDTRCLVAWGSNTVVVAFRGTASMKNALADLQVPFVLPIILAFAFDSAL